MNLRRWLSPCAFGHDEPLMTRNAALEARWACSRCQTDLGPILASPVKDGPAKTPPPVLGQPTGRAVGERRKAVLEDRTFERDRAVERAAALELEPR